MPSTVTIDLRHVARGLGIPLRQVQAVVELLDEGNTIPFITRYRKDQTGGLDEDQVRQVQARLAKMRLLADRKQTILRSIEAQGKLTEELARQIHSAGTTKRLEDLYLPFRPKKQTLATLARSRGLEDLAREIIEAAPACADLDARAGDFVNSDRQIPTPADALLGAGHIIAEQFSEQAELRQRLRDILQRTGTILSTQIGGEQKDQAERAAGQEKPPRSKRAPQDSGGTPTEDLALPENHRDPPAANETPEADAESPAEGESPQPLGAMAEVQPEQPPAPSPPETGQADPAQAEPAVAQPAPPDAEPLAATEVQQPAPAEAEQPLTAAVEPPVPPEPGQPVAVEGQQPAPAAAPPPPKVGQREPKVARLAKRELKELKKRKAEEQMVKAFRDYFDYREDVKKIPPHRVLAINRGERAKVLRVRIESDLEAMHGVLDEMLVPPEHPHADYLRGCARDALSRLILPSLEREARRELTDRAEAHAVGVFARNLRNLLLQPPVCDRRVLAVDPGFRSGCKLAALDQFGNMLEHGVVFLVGPPQRRDEAKQKVIELVDRYQLSVVVIGNGTACRQTEEFFAELIAEQPKDRALAYVIVNEAGASVYSVSRIGREEFPDYDASLRGAISIGRRLQDPLSELVKIDAANIGVGLYQHDVKAKHLRSSLDGVVESCVNYVGVDVNTASPALLRYVSGLNQLTARRLYEYRRERGPFRNREQLREVPGLGEATFVQAAGFLKITGSDNLLDATWIHPESYEAATRVLESLGCTLSDLTDKAAASALAERAAGIDLDGMAGQLGVGALTLKDILAQLTRPGRDPREDLPPPVFKHGILKLEDLTPGMELTGTVLNVVDFGAFVDIGMHDSGLVHVSQLADRYVRDPHEVVAVGQVVKVWVKDVDKERRRVSLSMIQPGTQRPRHPRHGEKPKQGDGSSEGGGQRARGRAKPRQARPSRQGSQAGPPRPPAPKHPPKPRPKPLIPITDAMKTGKEPMRTFGDLAQFFRHQRDDTGHEPPQDQPQPPAAEHLTPAATPEEPAAGQQSSGHQTEDTAQDQPRVAPKQGESNA